MRRWGVLVACFVFATTATAASDGNERDIFDRPVASLVSRGLPTLMLYANKGTKDAVQTPATEMAVRLHDVPFVTIVHVDLRDIPSLFRGIARGKIKRSHRDGVERFNKAFEAAGAETPPDAIDRLIFVADNDGAPHQSLGLGRGFGEAMAVVFDPSGHELCRGAFPRERDRIEQAIREASQRKGATAR